ncbi:unnamed protein product [Darwinula stevensoni]|uniref:Ran-binding protein 9 n=1 Tax=Darwinula stevensoni TaxID=69355 RepID=A0A7R8X2A6_9CRUS|nr:unnamed protein product [Darwinula stevensoni]CAG0883714.1 unnamed protein product [Darwinula stevensoni]
MAHPGGGSEGPGDTGPEDRLKALYPMVNEDLTPLPRCWSSDDKYSFIGLSQSNLRVHYKGHGNTHKDAASVRATHPIPAACGLYYFEVTIVSKGRDGYMGIGLSAQGVSMNRLPGWDKHSYGYHGDDGHCFCSSGTGQPYGPTFTTGDVIGCGVNLIDRTCFYTVNGHNLGVAFTGLPPDLYPTVGLQTPGEVVDANFGQVPFVFDIEDMMKEARSRVHSTIMNYPIRDCKGQWEMTLHRMVITYLIHHGYVSTAEAFARGTNQPFEEELASIKNRQKIQRLVLAGRMGEAIEATQSLYPGLLDRNPDLLFMLKCRQFVEMVNGTDSEVRPARSPKSHGSSPLHSPGSFSPSNVRNPVIVSSKSSALPTVDELNENNEEHKQDGEESKEAVTNGYQNGCSAGVDEMDVDESGSSKHSMNLAHLEQILHFGQELKGLSVRLQREHGTSEINQQMMLDAFSLLAYSDPWNSPVGWQLDPVQREPVCAALNSAILDSLSLPSRPPLELALGQARQLVNLMAANGLGGCAFANLTDLMQ